MPGSHGHYLRGFPRRCSFLVSIKRRTTSSGLDSSKVKRASPKIGNAACAERGNNLCKNIKTYKIYKNSPKHPKKCIENLLKYPTPAAPQDVIGRPPSYTGVAEAFQASFQETEQPLGLISFRRFSFRSSIQVRCHEDVSEFCGISNHVYTLGLPRGKLFVGGF